MVVCNFFWVSFVFSQNFGAGYIFFQYLATNLFPMVRARAVCIFLIIFFELFVTSVDIQAEFGRKQEAVGSKAEHWSTPQLPAR